jgi:5-methylthioadenosine/S-adenosylhomocysteine deaminase
VKAESQRIIVEADSLITPGGRVRADTAVLIEDGVVVAVESRAALAAIDADERLGGDGYIAMPGLVNAHQHGRADATVELGVPDAPLECWLVGLLSSASEDPYNRTLRLCADLAQAGITTTVHMHSTIATSAESYEDELRRVLAGYRDGGIRVALAAGLRDRGMPVYGDTEDFLARLPASLRRATDTTIPKPLPQEHAFSVIDVLREDVRAGRYGDATIAYGPAGPPWCSDQLLGRVAAASGRANALVHTHLLETTSERRFADAAHPGGAVAGLAALGLVNERLLLAHCVWLSEEDRAALATAGVSVVTNPASNLRLHAGVAAVKAMLSAGINVALGTDNMSLDGVEDLFAEARLMRALQRGTDVADDALDPATVLQIATENGGKAFGRTDLGKVQVRAAGDITLIRRDSEPPPGVDTLELLLSTTRRHEINAVVGGGRVLLRDGEPVTRTAGRSLEWPDPTTREVVAALLPHIREHYRTETSKPTTSRD